MNPRLLELLQLEIPSFPDPPVGFLEISGQAHRETVNSAIYAYFLRKENNDCIASLFMESLLNLIPEERKKGLSFQNYEVITEYSTANGRIDILIQDVNNGSAIIIENKIYHHLANDLNDYWNSLDTKIKNKVGIVLSLKEEQLEKKHEPNYFSLTHQKWIAAITNKGIPAGLSAREYIYVDDFINTMKRLSKNNEMDEETKFFFENQSKIIRATEIYTRGKSYILEQLSFIKEHPAWDNYGNNERWVHFWPKGQKEDMYYALAFEHLYNPSENGRRTFTIYIQIEKSALTHEDQLHDLIGNVSEYGSIKINPKGISGTWKHFAQKTYELNQEQLQGWAEFAMKEVEIKFDPLYKKMRSFLAETAKHNN